MNETTIIECGEWSSGKVDAGHILGIACTGHGAGLACLSRNGPARASVFDRWIGSKHTLVFAEAEANAIREGATPIDRGIRYTLEYAYGSFPSNRVFEAVFPEWLDWLLSDLNLNRKDIDLVVTSDSHFATCRARLAPQLGRWLPSLRRVALMEHHQIHQRQAYWQSGFEEAAIVTLDTCGEDLDRLGGRKLAGTLAVKRKGRGFETLSELLFPESSAGLIYAVVNHHIGFRQGQEGKTMGLAPYGRPVLFDRLKKHLRLRQDGGFDFLDHRELARLLEAYVPARPPRDDVPLSQGHMDVAYAGQAVIEAIVANAFRRALKKSGCKDLVYAGGVALNSVANQIALEAACPRRIYIAPNPSDTGQALGCALAGAYELAGWAPPRLEFSDYLGPGYSQEDLRQAAESAGVPWKRLDQPEEWLARQIVEGKIAARFNLGAEFGPRALGNRSILCDPRRAEMKDYLNARVKHRESFRPFAPSVLEEQAADWFELSERSPFMLRVVAARREARERIPAVVHVDGSARVQTVSRKENPSYWKLIDRFAALSGVPMLLNTSFNVRGKPIVETPQDAVDCFLSTEIDVLQLGPFVCSKVSNGSP